MSFKLTSCVSLSEFILSGLNWECPEVIAEAHHQSGMIYSSVSADKVLAKKIGALEQVPLFLGQNILSLYLGVLRIRVK